MKILCIGAGSMGRRRLRDLTHLAPGDIGGPVELVVADLSFISLQKVLPSLVTCLEPGRSAEHSYHTYCPEYIICCDAGQGLFGDSVHPYHWASRMQRSFETVYRKAHDSIRQRLHGCVDSGKLKGFVLSYLGQMDRALLLIPPDLVRREEVYKYPTDFSPMSDRDIELLTARGEQLTRLLISRYCPEL